MCYTDFEEDKLHDECGVVGIFLNKSDTTSKKEYKAYSAKGFNAATLAYYALYALQHRGQESAGIAISDGKEMKLHKGGVAPSERPRILQSLLNEVWYGRTPKGGAA